MLLKIFCLLFALFAWMPGASAETVVVTNFPYSLTEKNPAVPQGSTQLLVVTAEHVNVPYEETVHLRAELPAGLSAVESGGWHVNGNIAEADLSLSADFGQNLSVLSVKAEDTCALGEKSVSVSAEGAGLSQKETVSFTVTEGEKGKSSARKKKSLGWYIQSIVTPVSADGNRNDGEAKDTLYVRDVQLENIRNRLTGGGATNWGEVFSEPATYVLVELRNPKKDVRSLHFKAQLIDRETGEVKPGLVTPEGHSGFVSTEKTDATEAVISMDGKIVQGVVLPLYVDPYRIEEGDYSLRTTIWDETTSRLNESPLTIVKKRNIGLFALGFAACSACGILLCGKKLFCVIKNIGAAGDIAVALFASLAFGGVVIPVTLFGDFLHVILGPFAGLATGLLSGVLQYLLLFSLLTLFRRPGVSALFFLMKWLLAGVLFGRFTPVAVLNYSVYIAVLETVLYVSGFYRKETDTALGTAVVALLIGVSDMLITFLNLEQLMFFYRLYYADWFIGLYVIVNGLIYSTAGAWLGMRIGRKLSEVMGQ